MQLGHHMIPYPWLFFPGQWFRNQLMSEEQRMFCLCCWFCLALFFAPNALWWWAWGWRRFLWSISEKKLGLMVVSPIFRSLRSSFVLCCLGCWNQYLVGSLSRVRDLPKKHHRLHSDSLEEEHHFSEKKPAPLNRLPAARSSSILSNLFRILLTLMIM